MRTESLPRRVYRLHFYLLLLPALALAIIAQFIALALFQRGLFALLLASSTNPPIANYPYASLANVTLASSGSTIYSNTQPDSYVFDMKSGALSLKAPGPFCAAERGVLYTCANPIGESFTIWAYREHDGALLWSRSITNGNTAQAIDGILYVVTQPSGAYSATEASTLLALDASSGKTLWQFQCPFPSCTLNLPQVAHGIAALEADTSDSTVFALQTRNGALLWQASHYRNFIIQGDSLLASSNESNATLAAFRLADGLPLWTAHLPTGSKIVGTPFASSAFCLIQTLPASNSPGVLYALRTDTGAILWQQETPSKLLTLSGQTAILDNELHGSKIEGQRLTDGKLLWQNEIVPPSQQVLPYPQTNTQPAFNVSGIIGSIVIVQPHQYAFPKGKPTTHTFFALHLEDGTLAWQRTIQEPSIPTNVPPGQPILTLLDTSPALLAGATLYFAFDAVTSTIYRIHFTIFASSFLTPRYDSTTFALTTLAINAQNGDIIWSTTQSEHYKSL